MQLLFETGHDGFGFLVAFNFHIGRDGAFGLAAEVVQAVVFVDFAVLLDGGLFLFLLQCAGFGGGGREQAGIEQQGCAGDGEQADDVHGVVSVAKAL